VDSISAKPTVKRSAAEAEGPNPYRRDGRGFPKGPQIVDEVFHRIQCQLDGGSAQMRDPLLGYRTLTVVASLMSFEELPIISFTGSASTLN
jgi:hypothetical protein